MRAAVWGYVGSPLFFRLPSYPLTSTSSRFVPDFFNLNKPVTNLLSFIFMTYSCGRLVCRTIVLFFLTHKFPVFQANDDIEALMEIAAILDKSKMEKVATLHCEFPI
jgi:hypothetical protein